MRATFEEMKEWAKVDEEGVLTVRGKEVALVYYRSGYQKEQYMVEGQEEETWDEDIWRVRTLLECSMAIKCPSIDVQLATFKKFQQSFSDETLLETMMAAAPKEQTAALQPIFKGIWSMQELGVEGSLADKMAAKAMENPNRYVLKP